MDYEFYISNSTEGNRPIPTFASLLHTERDQKLPLVVFLGFEGWRVPRLLEDLEFTVDPLIPVVGCPGYKIDYPGFSVSANHYCLSNSKWFCHMRMTSARSPFAVVDLLEDLACDVGRMCIAPLGTTPMLLGSVLYVIKHPTASLVYDHPVRVHAGLDERGRTWVYDLSSFGNPT